MYLLATGAALSITGPIYGKYNWQFSTCACLINIWTLVNYIDFSHDSRNYRSEKIENK